MVSLWNFIKESPIIKKETLLIILQIDINLP
jgi:hypothetical protein